MHASEMTSEQAQAHLRVAYGVWLKGHQLLYPSKYDGAAPVIVTVELIRNTVGEFYELEPTLIVESFEDVCDALADDAMLWRTCLDKVLQQWVFTWVTSHEKVFNRVKAEFTSRSGASAREIKDIIKLQSADLLTSQEIAESWTGTAANVGRVMRTLGFERRRIRYSGANQWVWLVRNPVKYSEMAAHELLAVWEGDAPPTSFM